MEIYLYVGEMLLFQGHTDIVSMFTRLFEAVLVFVFVIVFLWVSSYFQVYTIKTAKKWPKKSAKSGLN